MKNNFLISGVGGQGILLFSDILGKAAIKEGLNVRGSETHGMAQRGGSVVSHIRIGNVFSPLIPKGGADFLVAMEPVEALRYVEYLKKDSTSIVNTSTIIPMNVVSKIGRYPRVEDILTELEKFTQVIPVDALELAKEAGSALATNVVLLGALTALEDFPFREKIIMESIKESVPPKTIEINLKALELGKKAVLGGI